MGSSYVSNQKIDRTYGHIDLATGNHAPHVIRSYTLFTNFPTGFAGAEQRQEWQFKISMPVAVSDRLSASDWDYVLRKLDTRPGSDRLSPIEEILFAGRMGGRSIEELQEKISAVVGMNLWRIFSQQQILRGDKAVAVPAMGRMRGNKNG